MPRKKAQLVLHVFEREGEHGGVGAVFENRLYRCAALFEDHVGKTRKREHLHVARGFGAHGVEYALVAFKRKLARHKQNRRFVLRFYPVGQQTVGGMRFAGAFAADEKMEHGARASFWFFCVIVAVGLPL